MRLRNQIRLSAFVIGFGFGSLVGLLVCYIYFLIPDMVSAPPKWPMILGVFAVGATVLALAESLKSPVASYCRGSLGAALFLANRPSDALPFLLKAFEEHSRPRPLAINAYYLGTAYREMNQLEKARSWYERAVQVAPKSRFGARALASLRDLGVGGSSSDA